MFSPSRKAFLGASLAGLASAPIFGASPLFKKPANATLFRPNTLFLTWQRDPTTTMTIQWSASRYPDAPRRTWPEAYRLSEISVTEPGLPE